MPEREETAMLGAVRTPALRRAHATSILAPFLLAGCATLFTGTTDTLTFRANVPGVRLSVDGQYKGELPLAVTMSRGFVGGQQFIARFERAGYVTQEFRLNRQFNAVAVLDVTSIPTSGGIDVLTGALMKFSPTDYHVQMLPAGTSAGSAGFQRGVRATGYALANHRGIQKDLARGGGEHLASFAAALAGGAPRVAELIQQASLREAPLLLAASTSHEFIERVNQVLAIRPALRPYRL